MSNSKSSICEESYTARRSPQQVMTNPTDLSIISPSDYDGMFKLYPCEQ